MHQPRDGTAPPSGPVAPDALGAARTRSAEHLIGPARSIRDTVDEVRYRSWRSLASEARLERPIFVIGCPRSGTSLAVKLLARHPDLANWSEAGRIWDPAGYDDPEADHSWGPERATAAERRRLHTRFEHRRRQLGRSRFINKHPRSSVRLDFIDEVFPDALYLHVIRDGRAVVNSIVSRVGREPYRQQVPFGDFCKPPGWRDLLREDPVEQAALQWTSIVSYVRERREALGERYLEFRYEDLCALPRTVLADLFSFVDLQVNARVIDRLPLELASENGKFRTKLTSDQIATVDTIGGEPLRELGYLGVDA